MTDAERIDRLEALVTELAKEVGFLRFENARILAHVGPKITVRVPKGTAPINNEALAALEHERRVMRPGSEDFPF